MKKHLWLLTSLLTVAFTLTCCGGDDSTNKPTAPDDPSGPNPPSSFSIVGTWVNRVGGDDNVTAEIVDLQEGNTCTYHYEKSATDLEGNTITMWEEKYGTWTDSNGTVTATFTRWSWYDGASGSHAEDEVLNETFTFPYFQAGSGILAFSPRMGEYHLYTRNGDVISLDQSGCELLGTWAYSEAWPAPSQHMITQYSYSFNADGTFEYIVRQYNSADNHYNQGNRMTGYYVIVPDGTELYGNPARPANVKGLVIVGDKSYMWDFEHQRWDSENVGSTNPFLPYEYKISSGKLYIGRYGLTEADLLSTAFALTKQ